MFYEMYVQRKVVEDDSILVNLLVVSQIKQCIHTAEVYTDPSLVYWLFLGLVSCGLAMRHIFN